jgi:hypothetical protein
MAYKHFYFLFILPILLNNRDDAIDCFIILYKKDVNKKSIIDYLVMKTHSCFFVFQGLFISKWCFFQKEKRAEHHTWRNAKKSYLRRSENASSFDILIHYGNKLMQYVHRQTDIH